MLYYSILKQEHNRCVELWVSQNGQEWPIFDYKISGDQIRLISDPDMSISEAIDLQELVDYVQEEGNVSEVPYLIVDELTGKNLDIKDRFEHKLVLEICN